MSRRSLFNATKKIVTGVVTLSLFVQLAGNTMLYLLLLAPSAVSAAEVAIDSTPSTDTNSSNIGGSRTVFVSDTNGYVFYRDSTGRCVYSKTTDRGTTWQTPVIFDNQTDCVKVSAWYDRWTPGDISGNFIHIATADTGDDDVFYNRLDTSTDTLLAASSINASVNSGVAPSVSTGNNTIAIAKATDDAIYITLSDNADAFVVSCAASCNTTTNWNEPGTSPLDNANDHSILVPLASAQMMIINRDISGNDIRSAVWNGSSWSGWTTIDSNATESTLFDGGVSAAVNKSNNDVLLVYTADNNNFTTDDHDIRTAVYSGGSWATQTNVLTNVTNRGIHDVTVAIDENSDDVYVAYAIRDTIGLASTGNIYYQVSTDGMSSWGAEQGPVSATAGDIYGPTMNIFDNERLYVSWYNDSDQTLYGETVVDIGPDTIVSALGSAISEVRAGESDLYTGGAYVIESASARTISEVILTESGSVDGGTELSDIKLFYEVDSTAPYNCVSESYGGGEAQFGITDSNGFSGPDGIATFNGTLVGVSPTQTLCLYPVVTVAESATDGATIDISIDNPPVDVTVSGIAASPLLPVDIIGSTTIVSASLTQEHFHWRNDDGGETDATSATGGIEDTELAALAKNAPRRVRIEVSNEGSTSTVSSDLTLEYATAAPTCDAAAGWSVVGSDSVWGLFNTGNVTDGADTTNIATSTGGVTDENTQFLTPNGGVRDATSTVPGVILDTNEFIEVEFSIEALSAAVEGETYCFRIVSNESPLTTYASYPSATIAADVTVSGQGSKTISAEIPETDVYLGGTFVIAENAASRNLTEVTLTESGTVDASTGLGTVTLVYDLDTTAPYNCIDQSYGGTEALFGTSTFNGSDGTATVTGNISVSTSSTICLYPLVDVSADASNGETVSVFINSPTNDVNVDSGSVGPATPVVISGTTTLEGAIISQVHYHWRNDDGSETGATSYTGGSEDVAVTDFAAETPIRLRIGVSNEGSVASVPTQYRLEYGIRLTTCQDIGVWTDVDSLDDDDWDMFDSPNLVNGSDTTDIAVSSGGVSDENSSFLTSNGGVRDTESITGTTTLSASQYTDLEFSITTTPETTTDAEYCFRVTGNNEPLLQYSQYASISTLPRRDFRVQRGTAIITGTSVDITAGIDYTAPASTSTAFARISNTHQTGAGRTAAGGSQRANDVTAYISDQSDITTSVTFTRDDITDDTRIDWEIIEFVGQSGTDNEVVVRDVGTVSFTSSELTATGTPATNISDDSNIVVFITGSSNQNTARNFYASQVTSDWDSATDQPTFERGADGGAAIDVSYAVVEYVGSNWNVQRVEHSYASAGAIETETIAPVNSLERAFLHTQKRMGADNDVVNHGHTVWLSGLGTVSFQIEGGASTFIDHTSVAWIIENTQIGQGALSVQRINGSTSGGAEPLALSISLPMPVAAMNNTSLFGSSRAAGANFAYPRSIHGLTLTSVSALQIWRSDTGSNLTYRTEIVEWPVAELALRQNYYRFYANNDALTPSDPWPVGVEDLGENTAVSSIENSLGEDEVIRARISVRAVNAGLSAGFQDFKLQYAEQTTTCSAVTNWLDVGDTASSSIWRGYAGTSTTDGTVVAADPPLPGELLLSVSDVGGRLEHENPSAANPYPVSESEDVEYDWYIQQNGATPSTVYCFRMSRTDGPLDGYFNYPTIRTAGFAPQSMDWQWYNDADNETPSDSLSSINTAPIEIENNQSLALRVSVDEIKNVSGLGAKFRLQYSDTSDFTSAVDVVGTSTCSSSDAWCYIEGPVSDNTTITTALLLDNEGCTAGSGNGCGTHNSNPQFIVGHTHGAGRTLEYSFTIAPQAIAYDTTYYFRLVNSSNGEPVSAASGETYPSLVSSQAALGFTIDGLPSGTSTAGIVTNISTSPTAIDYGTIELGGERIGAQRLTVDSNALDGFQIFKYARSQMLDTSGQQIPPLTASNTSPGSWAALCDPMLSSCIGYHTTDATLTGNANRFAAEDTYAGLHTELEEIMYSSLPATITEDLVYRIVISDVQPAGEYETEIVYIAVPVY